MIVSIKVERNLLTVAYWIVSGRDIALELELFSENDTSNPY